MAAPQSSADIVEARLRMRADRGVFQSFAAARRRGRLDCSIVWLHQAPIRLLFDPRKGTLEFRDLLPNLPRTEQLYKDLRRFLKERCAEALPSHRRIDPARLDVRARNRKGSVSITMRSLDSDWEHAVSKALKLVNEIFLGFLQGPYYRYMVETFDRPED